MNFFHPSRRVGWVSTLVIVALSLAVVFIALLRGAGVFLYHNVYAVFGVPAIWFGYWCSIPAALWIAAGGQVMGRSRFAAVTAVILVFFSAQVVREKSERWNFQARLERRMSVVRMALNNAIPKEERGPCDCFYARLEGPNEYLSSEQVILVSKHQNGISVTFYVDRAAFFGDDDYSAFIYRSDDGEPKTDEEDTDRFTKVVRLQPHWFYVEHT